MTTMKPGHKGEAVKIGFAGPSRSERDWLGPLAAVWSFRWILVAFVLIL